MDLTLFVRKRSVELILNSIYLVVMIWFVNQAYYELFVSIPRVHYPRVLLSSNGVKTISLNVPTVTAFIILFVGLLSICSSIIVYVINLIFKVKKPRHFWIIQIVSLIICFFSSLYAVYDFITTAFDGVG